MKNKEVHFSDWQSMPYQQAWDQQEQLLQAIVQQKRTNRQSENPVPTQNHLIFVEHPHVYTLGKSGEAGHLLANPKRLQEIQAEFVKTNRGGDITYHGPQQIVGYPILDLDNFKTDINWYLRSLEEVIILLMAEYGLQGGRSQGETGVWLDVGKPYARKICAMGVRASRWVTMHGFALNVNTNMKYFEYIVPCGIRNKAVTSLELELQQTLDYEKVKRQLKQHFETVFEVELVDK